MKNFSTLFLLSLIAIVGVFTLDVYLPGTSAMAKEFGVEISDIALTFCWFSIIFAFSQLFHGKISDYMGRKPVLISGLITAALATCLCIYSKNYILLVAARILQAIGISVFVVVQAIIRDLYDGNAAVRARILVTTVSGISISIAPTIGGLLQDRFSWQGGFFASLFLILMTLIYAVIFYRESNINRDKSKLKLISFIYSYFALITRKQYFIYVMLATLAYTIHFTFIIVSAYIFINLLGYTPIIFGYLMFFYGTIYFLTGLSTIAIVKRYTTLMLINFGGVVIGLGGIIMFMAVSLYPLAAWQILLPMMLITIGVTIIRTAATTEALSSLSAQAGQGSACLNLVQFLLSALIAATVSQFMNYSQFTISALAMLSAGIVLSLSRIVLTKSNFQTLNQYREASMKNNC